MKTMNKTFIIALSCFAIIAAGIFILGFTLGENKYKKTNECDLKFTSINKSLNCDNNYTLSKASMAEFKQKLDIYIENAKKSENIDNISVYFRDLHDGPTLGINDDEMYFSASLLKLPIAITFFKVKEEIDPNILKKELKFNLTGDYKPMIQNYRPGKTIKSGMNYTIEDLINNSLIYSDNLSNDVLKSTLEEIDSDQNLDRITLNELGLTVPNGDSEDILILF